MSTFLIRPILSYDDVHSVFDSVLANMAKRGLDEETCTSPYVVFQAVAAAMQVCIVNMTDNDLEEVNFRQTE